MEGKTLEHGEGRAAAGAVETDEVAAAPGAEQAPPSCCVSQTVVREGREVTVCVATCCGANQAA